MNPASRYVLEGDSPFPTGYCEGFNQRSMLHLKGASYRHIHGLVSLVVFSGDPAVFKISQASGFDRAMVLASIVLEKEVL